MDENTAFSLSYRKNIFSDNEDLSKSLDVQRINIQQVYTEACKKLDNLNTCNLLKDKLQKYSKTFEQNTDLGAKMKLLMKDKQCNFQINKNRSYDINSLMPKLQCSDKNTCISGPPTPSEYEEFLELMGVNSNQNNTLNNPGQSCSNFSAKPTDKNDRIGPFNVTSDRQDKKRNFSVAKEDSFKTARDELQLQHAKKFGNNSSSNNSKRQLGTRRTINSKFVSPILSNNDIEEKMDVSELEVDERLKNIDPKMIELIKSEIMDCGPNITWSDIAGLVAAKTAIQEAVVWPMLRPDIFTGLRRPPKGILLFGPPGTGKTLIGKCVASQSKSTFFSISASSLTSKWVGDGEKMVRALFSVARVHQPAVIFIDEIDSLLSQRSDSEHESSRRIKTEFLVQLDGATTDNEERILVIGATNRPQELDEAARRRFVKRLYIPLPEYEARLQLTMKLIDKERHILNPEDFEKIARLTDGFSGADMKTLCSEASLGPIRSIDMSLIQQINAEDVRPLEVGDFENALSRVRSSVAQKDLEQYIIWDKTYGFGNGK